MPPQQTNLTSETGDDAAGLRLAIASEDATGDALAAASPDVSIAAPRDVVAGQDAAGAPAASTRNVSRRSVLRRSVLRLLGEYWRAFQERRQRERVRGSLNDLSDRQLIDIGLTAGDVDHIAAHRAIEKLKDGTAYLWPSRGVM
jgi:uncharacterized protein YjiS (DUF1127 family)